MHFKYLLPINTYSHGFSTLRIPDDESHKLKITPIRLDDETLGVHRVSSKTSHVIVKPPLPRKFNTPVLAANEGKEAGVDDGSDGVPTTNTDIVATAGTNTQFQAPIVSQGGTLEGLGTPNAAQTRLNAQVSSDDKHQANADVTTLLAAGYADNSSTSTADEDDGDDKHVDVSTASVPLPKEAWEAFYPKGSINPNAPLPGGFSFYLSGPTAFANALSDGATEVILSYRVMLETEWEWVKGGKLPGIFGGVGPLSYGCTGGRQAERCKCFNIRPMWRAQGKGELYTYLPLTENNATRLAAVQPFSKQNPDYGFTVGRGAFSFEPARGHWLTLAFRIKLNVIGQEDGEIQLWANGKSVILVDGLSFRDSEESRIRGMHFQTFFGGHTEDWASPKDQRAWFADITGAIIN
ncbi:hypothetical protein BDN72DRAFT_845832 [Pluteus cervinus]|uniref:Uncharacterized protein n=1 Tax=Pluteus cervinus TaxID=181527 RepID=A0ACD3AH07_9AGAR|nr:hypothetical protein BDN72DRAFT_845832 [Pluteus cervinus]